MIDPRILSRRSFMRRMLGAGVGLLSLEFAGASLAMLFPGPGEGIGVLHRVGTLAEINGQFPNWASGTPMEFRPARAFLVNVPAAKAMALGEEANIPDPAASEILALWRKCPHLGCQVPQLCDVSFWFECLCHGSKYTILGEKRDGPAPRGMDHFPVTVTDGAYVVNTAEVVSGPPPGTVTFDDRTATQMSHCTG
jgi:cytochrome b6-f complex iron-sulfur subunit